MLCILVCCASIISKYVLSIMYSLLLSKPTNIYVVHLLSWIIYCTKCTVRTSTPYDISQNQNNKTSYNNLVIHILCSWNTLLYAEDNSCFFYSHTMMFGLWYWVAGLYKCCNWVVLTRKWIIRIEGSFVIDTS